MLELPLLAGAGERPTILLLGAHSDDIEIGCGGTVMRLVESNPGSRFHWVVFSASSDRSEEARASAALFLDGASDWEIEVFDVRESYFPYVGAELKDHFEHLKSRVSPDLVLTHCMEDRHQDHRMVSELTHNSFRDHLVLEYEIPKYDADLQPTTVFVPLSEELVDRKVQTLMKVFESQRSRAWFDERTFEGLMRIRGVECNAPDGYAEGFRVRKLRLDPGRVVGPRP
jgi:LmbE family N-acetylglucosaminyl deacetylase